MRLVKSVIIRVRKKIPVVKLPKKGKKSSIAAKYIEISIWNKREAKYFFLFKKVVICSRNFHIVGILCDDRQREGQGTKAAAGAAAHMEEMFTF